jgi:hypothetical protein
MIKRVFLAVAMLCAVNAHAEMHISKLLAQAPRLHAQALQQALAAVHRAADRGEITRSDLLTVIDYSIRSSEPRLFVFDLKKDKLLFRELCAHGKNSGGDIANFFSNDPGSEATSLGLFVTGNTYIGHNGYSLKLRGLSPGLNDMAEARAIVLHGAYYVSKEAIRVLGRLGRSWGCPAVRTEVAHKLIDTIRGGTAIFAYYPRPL